MGRKARMIEREKRNRVRQGKREGKREKEREEERKPQHHSCGSYCWMR